MQIPERLTRFLDDAKVSYEIVHHPEAFTAQELAHEEGVKGRNHAKVVMVKCDGSPMMTVLPADHRVDLEKLEKVVGNKTELATEEEFASLFPDCAIGTMPPFGGLYDVPAWVDRSLTEDEFIVFEAGTHTDAIRMSYEDYERIAGAKLADFGVKLH